MSEPSTCPHCSGEGKNANDAAKDADTNDQGQDTGSPAEACDVKSPCCCVKILCVVLAVALAIVLFVNYLVLPWMLARNIEVRTAYRNLKRIGWAMHNYEQKYGCFPPAYVADKDGKPMHSWRVLVLPFMEADSAKGYRLDEPWDSPNNRKVAEAAAKLFQYPLASHAKGDLTTDYMMVVGPHTISDGPHSRKAKEITDGLADTIMVVEVADSGVPWNKPIDLQFDLMNFRINSTKRMCIGGNDPRMAEIVFCDGSLYSLSEGANPELVKAMLTIDGGEPIPKDR